MSTYQTNTLLSLFNEAPFIDVAETVEFTIYLDSEKEDKLKVRVPIFESGSPEDWLEWLRHLQLLFVQKGTQADDVLRKINLMRSVLAGRALSEFDIHRSSLEEIYDDDDPDFYEAMEAGMTRKYVPITYARTTREFLQHLKKPRNLSVDAFFSRLKLLSAHLENMPAYRGLNTKLTDDELTVIFEHAMPHSWRTALIQTGRYQQMRIQEIVTYMKNLEHHEGSSDFKKPRPIDKRGRSRNNGKQSLGRYRSQSRSPTHRSQSTPPTRSTSTHHAPSTRRGTPSPPTRSNPDARPASVPPCRSDRTRTPYCATCKTRSHSWALCPHNPKNQRRDAHNIEPAPSEDTTPQDDDAYLIEDMFMISADDVETVTSNPESDDQKPPAEPNPPADTEPSPPENPWPVAGPPPQPPSDAQLSANRDAWASAADRYRRAPYVFKDGQLFHPPHLPSSAPSWAHHPDNMTEQQWKKRKTMEDSVLDVPWSEAILRPTWRPYLPTKNREQPPTDEERKHIYFHLAVEQHLKDETERLEKLRYPAPPLPNSPNLLDYAEGPSDRFPFIHPQQERQYQQDREAHMKTYMARQLHDNQVEAMQTVGASIFERITRQPSLNLVDDTTDNPIAPAPPRPSSDTESVASIDRSIPTPPPIAAAIRQLDEEEDRQARAAMAVLEAQSVRHAFFGPDLPPDDSKDAFNIETPRPTDTPACFITLAIDSGRTAKHGKKFQPLRALVDSGSHSTFINEAILPKNTKIIKGAARKWTTEAGTFSTNKYAHILHQLPQFTTARTCTHKMQVVPLQNARYDVIIGRDLLTALGIKIDFGHRTLEWDELVLPMPTTSASVTPHDRPDTFSINRSTYRYIDDIDITNALPPHLSEEQQDKLRLLLLRYRDVFEGTIGTLPLDPVDVQLKEGTRPIHSRPYPVPKARLDKVKAKAQQLEAEGIWIKNFDSPWAAPSFGIDKPNGDIRMVTDFRKVNAAIQRSPFPFPRIEDIFHSLDGTTHATALDFIEAFFHILLSKRSQQIFTTVLPWGKYSYVRLPMGFKGSPDLFQWAMSTLFSDIPEVIIYIDDVLIVTKGSFLDHLTILEKVLQRCREVNLLVNIKKSTFCGDEFPYLGFILTTSGLRPDPTKVLAIQQIAPPKTRKALQSFLGMVNYLRSAIPRYGHFAAPLSSLTGKGKFQWTHAHQSAFDGLKQQVMKATMLSYPDYNQPFEIYTDASKLQVGSCIIQRNADHELKPPIAFFSKKLTDAATRYTVTEQELLAIVLTLKAFKTLLFGQQIQIFTDHKNLTFENLTSERVRRWRLFVEEFGPTITYLPGAQNVVADALSRLPIDSPNTPPRPRQH